MNSHEWRSVLAYNVTSYHTQVGSWAFQAGKAQGSITPPLPWWCCCGCLPDVRPYLLLSLTGDGRKGNREAWREFERLLQAFDIHHGLHGVELVHLPHGMCTQRARKRRAHERYPEMKEIERCLPPPPENWVLYSVVVVSCCCCYLLLFVVLVVDVVVVVVAAGFPHPHPPARKQKRKLCFEVHYQQGVPKS